MEREFQVKNIKFVIDNLEEAEKRIHEYAGYENIIDDIIHFIQTEENTIFYLNEDFTTKQELDENQTRYVLLDTGLVTKGNPMFFSLIRYEHEFCGHYVRDIRFLSAKLRSGTRRYSRYDANAKSFPNKYRKWTEKREHLHLDVSTYEAEKETKSLLKISEIINETDMKTVPVSETSVEVAQEEVKTVVPADIQKEVFGVTKDVFDQLLFPRWESIEGLDRYIKIIGIRLKQLIEQQKTEYYIENTLNYVVVNTGLVDNLGNDILVIYRKFLKTDRYEAYKRITRKMDFLDNRFSKEDSKRVIKPVSFFDSEDPFNPTWDDIDFNQECLFHIINERRERLPEEYQNMDSHLIANSLIEALRMSVGIFQKDHHFAKASYSGKYGVVSWFLPLYLKKRFTEEPELVIAIRKVGDYYEPKTILQYDSEMKDKFRALSLYGEIW